MGPPASSARTHRGSARWKDSEWEQPSRFQISNNILISEYFQFSLEYNTQRLDQTVQLL